MKTRHILTPLVFALMIWPFTAMSAEEPAMNFELLDIDGDGFISKSEATQNVRLRERWNNADKDNDGKLSAEEFATFAKASKQAFPEK